MCGSSLSKFKTSRKEMDPEMKIFPEPRRVDVRAVQPLNSTDFTLSLKQVKNTVAFDIPVGDKVYPPARVSRRLRLRKQKVAPKRTLEDVKEKMRAAEERKLKELQRIRKVARELGCGVPQPHPSEAFAQATVAKIAAEQAAAESKRNKELDKRKQAGNRSSQNRGKHAKEVKMSEEEEEIHADLQQLDTYCASDENASVHGWEDFFSD